MARFYGELRSKGGKVARCGSINQPLSVVAATYSGAVQVDLFDHEGADWCEVYLRSWEGNGVPHDQSLYYGPVNQFEPHDVGVIPGIDQARRNQ